MDVEDFGHSAHGKGVDREIDYYSDPIILGRAAVSRWQEDVVSAFRLPKHKHHNIFSTHAQAVSRTAASLLSLCLQAYRKLIAKGQDSPTYEA